MTADRARADGSQAPHVHTEGAAGPRRLSLGDPLDGRPAEDRPESWGESGESESERLARYRTETPPHHGG